MKGLVWSYPVASKAKIVQIHKLFLTISALVVFSVQAALPVNAQCTSRPRSCTGFGSCGAFLEWLVDGTFSENCTSAQGGWVFFNASRAQDNGFCGLSQNSYARLPQDATMYQRFQHNASYMSPEFWLGFDIEGGNPQAQGGELVVWIYNSTNKNWTLVATFPNTSSISCGHSLYSFYRPDWVGKLLYIYFDTTMYEEGNWRIDGVTFAQRS
jgi:hypothetical protein